MSNICPVCFYPDLDEPAYTSSGNGSLEYCPCCGFQFGYHDQAQRGYRDENQDQYFTAWRERWIAEGMKWKIQGIKPPEGWNAEMQLVAYSTDQVAEKS